MKCNVNIGCAGYLICDLQWVVTLRLGTAGVVSPYRFPILDETWNDGNE